MNIHFSSKTCEWETPQKLFDELNKEFHFTMDVCATYKNKKCKNYFSKEAEIRFLKGRLKFGNQKNSAPFPSMVVIWK